ncbi:MAG: UPF0280 family protein [Candidatus Lokiarchaeota archaeon]
MKTYKHHFSEKESDITIISESKKAIELAKESFFYHRRILEEYVMKNEEFQKSFSPVDTSSKSEIIQLMSNASFICGVGPMATVAGALADLMLHAMDKKEKSGYEINNPKEIRVKLIENGGELSIDSELPMKVGLFAGKNPLNLNIGFNIEKKDCPIGIGTSSGTIGHAISLGESDAVTIFAKNATLADGGATKIGNVIKGEDIEKSIKVGLDLVDDLDWIKGAFISRKDKVGYTGKLPQIIKIEGDKKELLMDKGNSILFDDFEIFK